MIISEFTSIITNIYYIVITIYYIQKIIEKYKKKKSLHIDNLILTF